MGSVAIASEKPKAIMKAAPRDIHAFVGDWQVVPAKAVLSVVKGGEAMQISSPFTRVKKEEPAQPLQEEQARLPPDNYFG